MHKGCIIVSGNPVEIHTINRFIADHRCAPDCEYINISRLCVELMDANTLLLLVAAAIIIAIICALYVSKRRSIAVSVLALILLVNFKYMQERNEWMRISEYGVAEDKSDFHLARLQQHRAVFIASDADTHGISNACKAYGYRVEWITVRRRPKIEIPGRSLVSTDMNRWSRGEANDAAEAIRMIQDRLVRRL